MFWALLQVVLVFGGLGYGAWYLMKKTKMNQFSKVGTKGRISVLDGINLNYQTSAYLIKADGTKALVVISPNGLNTTVLRNDISFDELINQQEEVAVNEVQGS